MKVGIVSDVHGNVFGLEAALNTMGEVDALICAGDLTGYYYWANEAFELLEERNCHLIAGNHDVFLLRYLGYDEPKLPLGVEKRIPSEREYRRRYGAALSLTKRTIKSRYVDWLRGAGLSLTIDFGGLRVSVFHGSPWNPFDEYVYPDNNSWDRFTSLKEDSIILGHTHHPFVELISGRLIVNPGSCGQPRDYDPRAAYALLDTKMKCAHIHRVTYDVEKVVDEVYRHEPHNLGITKVLTRTRDSS